MSAKWRRNKKYSERFFSQKNFGKSRKAGTRKVDSYWIKRTPRISKMQTPIDIAEIRKYQEPNPLVDILESHDEITVISEFAGFKKENMKIQVRNQRLTLSAKALDRKYYKSLNLPKRVIPNTLRTRFKNGVFEIRLRKGTKEKAIRKTAG